MKCITCGENKDADEFLKVRGAGYGKRCLGCRQRVSATSRQWFAENGFPERYNDQRRRKLYGLEPEHFDALRSEQDGRCAICSQPATLVIDHCHQTGLVRGLLCNGCNTAIGLLKDNVEILESAIRYLRRSRVK